MKYIDELLFPEDYNEIDIQREIQENSDIIFPGCKSISPYVVDASWKPDLFYLGAGKKYVIIGEIKGSPPANKFDDAFDQLLGYVNRFTVWYPDLPVKAILFGPWKKSSHILSGYYTNLDAVGNERLIYCNMRKLGRWLASTGSGADMRRVLSRMPYCYIPPTPLEIAARQAVAYEQAGV